MPLAKAIGEDVDDLEMDTAAEEDAALDIDQDLDGIEEVRLLELLERLCDADADRRSMQTQEDAVEGEAGNGNVVPSQPNKKAKKKNKRAALMQSEQISLQANHWGGTTC